MNTQVEIINLIKKLAEAQIEYDRLVFDEEEEHKLGSPASQKQIDKLENILKKPLPPSYCAFLELHNGWSDFDGGAKLLSTEDQEDVWVKERIKNIGELFFEGDSKNPFLNGCIPILLGKEEHNYLVLDPNTVRKDGEMDFIMYDYGQVEECFKNFISFLQDSLKIKQELIEEEKLGINNEDDHDNE
jgi:hypothetical protein